MSGRIEIGIHAISSLFTKPNHKILEVQEAQIASGLLEL